MKKLLLVLLSSLILTACSSPEDKHPVIHGNRLEVHNYYLKTFGSDPIKWEDSVKKAYDRDMDSSTVITN